MPAADQATYAELHCLSCFSFQRGASHADELVERAAKLGYQALAITDECSLAGIVRAHLAAQKHGLQLIVGSELTLGDGLRLVLLAPDREAYGDLSQLISLGRRNANKGSYQLDRAAVAHHAARLLALWLPPALPDTADGLWLGQHFPDRAWLAVELFQEADDGNRLSALLQLGQQCGLPCVASGDVHMHVRSRRALQDVMTAIRLGRPVAECGLALFPNGERHLRSPWALAHIYPRALLAETVRIAQRCGQFLADLGYEYPAELVPEGATPASHLCTLTEIGLNQRYPAGAPEKVRRQIAHELALITRLRYESFFLTVHDIVAYARSQKILCQGRGSAANSAVCFALGITEVDPDRSNLLFERFLSQERQEPPDIDVDFEHDRREEVIQYIYKRYGRERAALAATVITYRPRSALRDVGRALGFDEEQLDQISKTLAWWDSRAELPKRLQEAGFDPESRPVQLLLRLAQVLMRFPRHLSQHVGGFVISHSPLARLVPIENAAMPDRTVIQWDKDDLDAMGLLKVDVLALGMLSAIRRTLALVSAIRQQPLMRMADIPAEDPQVYEMIGHADTVGLFQIESRAQMSMLPRLKPKTFYDLVVEVAIVRPGPIQGGMVHPYLRRRQGLEPVDYPSEAVKKTLERTLGVPIFQEQVMQLAIDAADFTPGEADQLRRSMGSWRRTGELADYQERLVTGMLANGYTQEFADRLCKQIEGFSEYGFPESHAASFALLVYVSGWLKRHEPAAFTCALLNSLPMGFYSASQLIQDAKRHGIVVYPVDVQRSDWDCTLEDEQRPQHALRLGLRLISGLGRGVGERIAVHRPAAGYDSLIQLQRLAGLDKRSLGILADADALASLAGNRRQARWQVGGLQLEQDLAGMAAKAEAAITLPLPSLGQQVLEDYRSQGLTLRAHPLSLLRPRLSRDRLLSSAELRACQHGQPARACGIVVGRQRPGTASGVTFVTLEDETGNTNVIVWQDLGERQRKELLGARLLAVYGVVQREGEVVHLLAKRLADKSELLGTLSVESRDFH
ncbi:error-prone DNA polymerase [Chitinimonas viridis]|uniref:Error-prone DNA polymerase n=1 Tax=Chitinimonas viridis TaxID=664880 RepID=A0ABT8BBG6_9NEIS|nr:error-prone DNA polymerase [Chitinimonas viridis]MDN3579087.1 error-prone DNA polymerase [Chitinimonas viridis]